METTKKAQKKPPVEVVALLEKEDYVHVSGEALYHILDTEISEGLYTLCGKIGDWEAKNQPYEDTCRICRRAIIQRAHIADLTERLEALERTVNYGKYDG